LTYFRKGALRSSTRSSPPTSQTAAPVRSGVPAGREGIKAIASALRKGFPDLTYKVDLQIAEGDFVAGYVTVSGTHKGEVFGMPATGKHAEWTESHIVKLVNGKITEHWGVIDQLGMLRQLGLAPTPEAVPAGR